MTGKDRQSKTATADELLRRFVRKGSEAVFTELVERYLGLVLGARKRIGNESMAEDIAQSTFAILARKAVRLKATPTLAAWLYRVTIVECTTSLRRHPDNETKMRTITERARLDAAGESVWQKLLISMTPSTICRPVIVTSCSCASGRTRVSRNRPRRG